MLPGDEPEERPRELTPAFLALLTVGAVVGQVWLLLMLMMFASPALLPNLGIATIVAYGAALAVAVPRIPPPPSQALGFSRPPSLAWVAAGLLLPSILLVSEIDNVARALVSPPEALEPGGDTRASSAVEIAEAVLVLALVVPAVEEIFFRGLLQPALVRQLGRLRGLLGAAALTTLPALALSALALSGPWVLAPSFARALALGVLREASGSLLPCLGLAVLFGVAHVLALQGAFGIPGFDDLSEPHTPLEWLAPAALATGAGLRLCQIAARRRPADPHDART